MYEHNGEKYFIVDSHMHYWNAAPDNWVKGAEQYAKGWIECFHAYQGLGPAGALGVCLVITGLLPPSHPGG